MISSNVSKVRLHSIKLLTSILDCEDVNVIDRIFYCTEYDNQPYIIIDKIMNDCILEANTEIINECLFAVRLIL